MLSPQIYSLFPSTISTTGAVTQDATNRPGHPTSIGFREWGCHLPTHIAQHRHVGPHERPCFQACARAQPAVTRMEILRYTIGKNMFQKDDMKKDY